MPGEKYAYESALSGMYLSGNPMSEYMLCSQYISTAQLYSINDGELCEGDKVTVCGIVSRLTTTRTKSGIFICTMSFSDYYDTAEVTVFESAYNKYRSLFSEGAALVITAQVRKRNEQISLSLISACDARTIAPPKDCRLYVRLSDSTLLGEVTQILSRHSGDSIVCLVFDDTGRRVMSDSLHGVSLGNELITELCDVLGAENIRIK